MSLEKVPEMLETYGQGPDIPDRRRVLQARPRTWWKTAVISGPWRKGSRRCITIRIGVNPGEIESAEHRDHAMRNNLPGCRTRQLRQHPPYAPTLTVARNFILLYPSS